MKLIELGLVAFGPFADLRLDFSQTGALQLIYGPNEAGKSTSLRAITNLLYGIPVNTQDAHRHAMPDLRLTARLARANGSSLEVVRRKGSKNTLLDSSGNPLSDDALAPFLAGVSENVFRTMFGLDHVTLREGAEALLQGKGAVGESLFAAAIGGPGLHAHLNQLEEEAAALYKKSGQKPHLNEAIKLYLAADKRSRESVRSADAYRAQQEALTQARAENAELSARRRELAAELSRLQRALRVLPLLRRRQQLDAQRAALGQVPRLPEDAGVQRARVQAAYADAQREQARLEQETAELRQRRNALRAPESILSIDIAVIEALQNALGSVRAAAADLPRRRGELSSLEDHAATIVRELGRSEMLDRLDELRVSPAAQARIRGLAQARSGLSANRDNAARAHAAMLAKVAAQREQLARLPEVPDVRRLQQALRSVRRLGDLDDAIALAEGTIQDLDGELRARRAALPLWHGDEQQLRQVALPDAERIDLFRQRFAQLSSMRSDLMTRQRQLEQRAADLARDMDELRLAGAVPTEAELEQQRGHRDVLWQRLRRDWNQVTDADADHFETTVCDVDGLADRLRREAGRVATLARLTADRTACANEHTRFEREDAELARADEQAQREWRALWSGVGIDPLEPHAMSGWLARAAELLELSGRCEREGRSLAQLLERRARHHAQLAEAAAVVCDDQPPRTDDLASMIAWGEDVLQLLTERQTQRRAVAEGLAACEADQQSLERAAGECQRQWNAWQEEWTTSIAPLGLPANASPEEALAMLDELARLFAKTAEAAKLRQRIQAMEDDARRLAEEVATLARQHMPDLGALPATEGADAIIRAYRAALDEQRERERIDEELRVKDERKRVCEEGTRHAEAQLRAMMERASVTRIEELERTEQAAVEAARVAAAQRDVDDQLAIAGEGASLADLTAQTNEVDPDVVKARIAEVEGQLETLAEDQRVLHQRIGSYEAGIEHQENAEGAADAAAEAQEHLAAIKSHVRKYLRLRLASRVIRREIERYRERNQGPLVARASVLFPRLTLGRYSGVRIGFDAADEPVLRCVNQAGRELGVEDLSDGARDQLYLALRVATLEHHAESNPAMPVVLDDVLVHFDDERTRAALAVLADLAQHTQVLLFTHHARVVEIARATLLPDRCVEHVLTRAG